MVRAHVLSVRLGAGALALALCTLALPARADDADAPVRVKVERVRPRRETLPTLQFLKANRDFFRSRLDQLREKPLASRDRAGALDPRFLAYRRMIAGVLASSDSTAAIEDARSRRELFASVTDLGRLEAELDEMDRLLAAQRIRLTALQEDFDARQRTTLAVVVSGCPRSGAPDSIAVALEDGARFVAPLSEADRNALAAGGALQIFHGLIEPREQVLAIGLAGGAWAAGDSAFVTLEPPRDRMTFLQLDLSQAGAASGASGLQASTWQRAGVPAPATERPSEP
ncbi:MAG TPA: hypothetical protein VMH61_07020 [Candidatus Acidoferrales bacterium]|nr:hypothetical protein [Candidatus Acidoferrales bacterium]